MSQKKINLMRVDIDTRILWEQMTRDDASKSENGCNYYQKQLLSFVWLESRLLLVSFHFIPFYVSSSALLQLLSGDSMPICFPVYYSRINWLQYLNEYMWLDFISLKCHFIYVYDRESVLSRKSLKNIQIDLHLYYLYLNLSLICIRNVSAKVYKTIVSFYFRIVNIFHCVLN